MKSNRSTWTVWDCLVEEVSDCIGASASDRNKNLFILLPLSNTNKTKQNNN